MTTLPPETRSGHHVESAASPRRAAGNVVSSHAMVTVRLAAPSPKGSRAARRPKRNSDRADRGSGTIQTGRRTRGTGRPTWAPATQSHGVSVGRPAVTVVRRSASEPASRRNRGSRRGVQNRELPRYLRPPQACRRTAGRAFDLVGVGSGHPPHSQDDKVIACVAMLDTRPRLPCCAQDDQQLRQDGW